MGSLPVPVLAQPPRQSSVNPLVLPTTPRPQTEARKTIAWKGGGNEGSGKGEVPSRDHAQAGSLGQLSALGLLWAVLRGALDCLWVAFSQEPLIARDASLAPPAWATHTPESGGPKGSGGQDGP